MINALIKKIIIFLITIFSSSIIIFFMLEALPGDPASFMLGINATNETVSALKEELGLTENIFKRYFSWFLGMFTGDFGISFTYRVKVSELILQRSHISIPLALYSLFLTLIISFPLAIICVYYENSRISYIFIGSTQIAIALPNFWLALILIIFFGIYMNWFPVGGFPGWEEGLFICIKSLTLPAFSLALPQAAILIRIIRTSLLSALEEDYIKTAKSKGLREIKVITNHALKNSLLSILTIIGLQLSFLIAGTIIIENIFYLPGIGRLIFQSISQRDLIVVESMIMLLVIFIVFINFIIDVLYTLIDPRLRK